MPILLPLISGLLYRMGGTDQWKWCPFNQKLWRGPILGLVIGLICWHSWLTLVYCILSYWIIPGIFPYGSKSWLNFLPQNWKHFVSGMAFGACLWPIVGIACIWQAFISGIAFYLIEKKGLDNPYCELFRGCSGTIIYPLLWLLRR